MVRLHRTTIGRHVDRLEGSGNLESQGNRIEFVRGPAQGSAPGKGVGRQSGNRLHPLRLGHDARKGLDQPTSHRTWRTDPEIVTAIARQTHVLCQQPRDAVVGFEPIRRVNRIAGFRTRGLW